MFLFHERNKWKWLFLFHDLFPLEFVFRYSILNIYVMCWKILQPIKYLLELIKIRSKNQEKNMPCERRLNFDQWKKFSENYKPMRVWLWLVDKFNDNYCRLRLFCLRSFKLRRKYVPNLKAICHIKLQFFLWTIPLGNLLLAKYLISVAAPLMKVATS